MIDASLAVKLIGYLVKTLKVKRLKRIILNSPEAKSLGGMYVDKEIHLPGEWIRTSTLLHEFTHHVCQVEKYSDGHGPKFCEMLELVYQAAMEYIGI